MEKLSSGRNSRTSFIEDPDMILPTISSDVIFAYGAGSERSSCYSYTKHSSDSRCCTCLFWSRYSLYVINFIVWAAGLAIVGLGAWTHIESLGLDLFDSLLRVPSILLMTTGAVMVLVGICGWVGALRLNVTILRVFMAMVSLVFALQLASGALVFLMLGDIEQDMKSSMQTAIATYGQDNYGRDKAIDYLESRFKCCGASGYADWEINQYYNCSSPSPSSCGVPSSCCLGKVDGQCGYGTRNSERFAEMFIYTHGCIDKLMGMFKDNITLVAAIAFTVCLFEIASLLLAKIVIRDSILHRKLIAD